MKYYFQTIIILFCIMGSLTAQPGKEVLVKVLNLSSEDPISYATIRFKYTNQGLVANDDGTFRLPVDFLKEDITLVISAIGYATTEVETSKLSEGMVNNIYIPSQITTLDAVILKLDKREREKIEELPGVLSPRAIVRTAINNIRYNYPAEPHSYISYYRDYQKYKNEYYNLNEGILETFDEGISWPNSQNDSIKSALYSFATNTDYPIDSVLLQANYGHNKFLSQNGEIELGTPLDNELALLKIHNPIRNFSISSFSFINVFDQDFIENHTFELVEIVFSKDGPLYEIEFASKKSVSPKYYAVGRIFVSTTTYGIYRLNYGVYSRPNRELNVRFTGARLESAYVEQGLEEEEISHFEVSISYSLINNRLYPKYITFNNRFEIEDYPFKFDEITFDRESKSFIIRFNNNLDSESIKRKYCKIFYKDKKLFVKNVRMIDERTISAKVIWRDEVWDLNKVSAQDFRFEFRKIKDQKGKRIDEPMRLVGYQFRELFTQEVFTKPNKGVELNYVVKNKALRFSPQNNTTVSKNKYWVNSPLRDIEINN